MAAENCPSSRKRPGVGRYPSHISKLGDDLLVEILIRLPNLRSASRCKPVCKRWRSLISSPRFNGPYVSRHRINSPHMPDNPDELQSIIASFLPPMPSAVADSFKVFDCFKDLVLCGFWDVDSDNKEPARSYLVCNPFTKQWVALPVGPEKPVGYGKPITRFVFEPRISYHLDLGDDQQTIVYSEYRFRVVCMYEHDKSTNLDLFCSESGKWTKEPLVLHGTILQHENLVSCNGELFWKYCESQDLFMPGVAAFNPFRPDVPPTCIDPFPSFGQYWDISASQGHLHLVERGYRNKRIVWRLERDGKSWSKQCKWFLKSSRSGKFDRAYCFLPCLHPHKPEIIFFHYFDKSGNRAVRAILSLDLRTRELVEFAKLGKDAPRVTVFHPMVSCLPTPIPRYEELRGVYDGSHSFWVQSSSTTTTPSITAEECEPVDGVEQFGHWRKDKGSASNPWHCLKKQKVTNDSYSKRYDAIGRKLYVKVKEGALINCRRNRRSRRNRRWHLFN